MIADDVAKMLYDLRKKIYARGYQDKEPTIIIYIDNHMWHQMMSEISGPVSSAAFDLYESKGRTLSGCQIHRVITEGHGIKVFEE